MPLVPVDLQNVLLSHLVFSPVSYLFCVFFLIVTNAGSNVGNN